MGNARTRDSLRYMLIFQTCSLSKISFFLQSPGTAPMPKRRHDAAMQSALVLPRPREIAKAARRFQVWLRCSLGVRAVDHPR